MQRMPRKNWTKEEQILALNLYHILPFGRLDRKTPEIIALAKIMGRTPSSLSMKLCNFASLDPEITANGRVGLPNVSNKDRDIWQWHVDQQEEFNSTYKKLIKRFDIESDSLTETLENKLVGKDKIVLSRVRIGQGVFRKMVLNSYQNRCCISGLDVSKLLVASHIKPWRDDEKQRMNPRNGLCLSSIHDRAFDQGLLTISDYGEVILSKSLKGNSSTFVQDNFHRYEGKKLKLPSEFSPDFKLIKYHRENIFIG